MNGNVAFFHLFLKWSWKLLCGRHQLQQNEQKSCCSFTNTTKLSFLFARNFHSCIRCDLDVYRFGRIATFSFEKSNRAVHSWSRFTGILSLYTWIGFKKANNFKSDRIYSWRCNYYVWNWIHAYIFFFKEKHKEAVGHFKLLFATHLFICICEADVCLQMTCQSISLFSFIKNS